MNAYAFKLQSREEGLSKDYIGTGGRYYSGTSTITPSDGPGILVADMWVTYGSWGYGRLYKNGVLVYGTTAYVNVLIVSPYKKGDYYTLDFNSTSSTFITWFTY